MGKDEEPHALRCNLHVGVLREVLSSSLRRVFKSTVECGVQANSVTE